MKQCNRKKLLLLLSLVLLMAAGVMGTMAYLTAQTPQVVNTFEIGKLPPAIIEEIDGDVKNNVAIQNNGNVNAYVRAVVVITWVDEDGNVWPQAPKEDMDYKITWTKAGWTEKDGFYYHKAPVGPGGSTGVLFTGCKPVTENVPEGYHLSVEIMSQSIQALGMTDAGVPAVTDAWGVAVDADGTLKIG